MCIYLHIHAVKNTTICQMVSLCNMHHNVIYDMFRPCMWAIIRLFVVSAWWLYNRSLGGQDLVPPKLLLYSHHTGSTNNLMMAHLQGRNMSLYVTSWCILHSDTIWQVVVFLTACMCKYIHIIHCISDLTQRGWHSSRAFSHFFVRPN